jgi:hypothetical protein
VKVFKEIATTTASSDLKKGTVLQLFERLDCITKLLIKLPAEVYHKKELVS